MRTAKTLIRLGVSAIFFFFFFFFFFVMRWLKVDNSDSLLKVMTVPVEWKAGVIFLSVTSIRSLPVL